VREWVVGVSDWVKWLEWKTGMHGDSSSVFSQTCRAWLSGLANIVPDKRHMDKFENYSIVKFGSVSQNVLKTDITMSKICKIFLSQNSLTEQDTSVVRYSRPWWLGLLNGTTLKHLWRNLQAVGFGSNRKKTAKYQLKVNNSDDRWLRYRLHKLLWSKGEVKIVIAFLIDIFKDEWS